MDEVATLITDALAQVEGLVALLAVGESPIQIEPFQLQMLLVPIRDKLKNAEALSRNPLAITLQTR